MATRTKFTLLLSSLFFTLLQPGVVAGLIPFILIRDKISQTFLHHFGLAQIAGIFMFGMGLAMLMDCILRFVSEGRGTLSPADPTKGLVIRGLYRYSRNPMYAGVMAMLVGEALFFREVILWGYACLVAVIFTGFIILVEEPRLKRDFGDAYMQYQLKVRRWF